VLVRATTSQSSATYTPQQQLTASCKLIAQRRRGLFFRQTRLFRKAIDGPTINTTQILHTTTSSPPERSEFVFVWFSMFVLLFEFVVVLLKDLFRGVSIVGKHDWDLRLKTNNFRTRTNQAHTSLPSIYPNRTPPYYLTYNEPQSTVRTRQKEHDCIRDKKKRWERPELGLVPLSL